MTPDLIAVIADVAGVLLGAAALALSFYVRATADEKITARCEALREEGENGTEALKAEIDGELKARSALAAAAKREYDSELKSVTAALYTRIDAFGDRLHELENKVDDTARRADLFQLSLQLATMSGELKAITTRIEAIAESSQLNSAALKRVENHMFHIEGQ